MNVNGILRTARLASWAYRVVSTVAGLVTIRLINDQVGLVGYGEVAVVLSFLGGIAVVDFGFLQAISRFTARFDHVDQASRRPYFWTACALAATGLFVFQVTLIVCMTVVLGFIDKLPNFNMGELMSLGFVMMLGNMLSAGSAIFAGFQRYGMAAAAKIARTLAYLIVIVMFWATGELTVHTVLWSNSLTLLVANTLICLLLLAMLRDRLGWNWHDFPAAHLAELREFTTYSLNGWMFSLSTVLVSSGGIVAAGLILPLQEVAKLQVVLVLYSGVAVFVTGSMTPLSTIIARNSDGSALGRERIAGTARNLIEEAIVFTAVLLVFFTNYGSAVLSLLLGSKVADSILIAQTQSILLTAVLPALAILPFFVFRFAMVSTEDNAAFSKRVVVGTIVALATGFAASAFCRSLFGLAAGVGVALMFRGALAYRMGKHILPGLTLPRLLMPLAAALLVCSLLSLAIKLATPVGRSLGFNSVFAQAALYLMFSTIFYMQRTRLHRIIGLRLP